MSLNCGTFCFLLSGCENYALGRWSLYKPVFFWGGGGDNNYHSREQHDDGFHSNRGEEMAPFYQHLHNSMANETAGCLLRNVFVSFVVECFTVQLLDFNFAIAYV